LVAAVRMRVAAPQTAVATSATSDPNEVSVRVPAAQTAVAASAAECVEKPVAVVHAASPRSLSASCESAV
jgi:hypothetical protein